MGSSGQCGVAQREGRDSGGCGALGARGAQPERVPVAPAVGAGGGCWCGTLPGVRGVSGGNVGTPTGR